MFKHTQNYVYTKGDKSQSRSLCKVNEAATAFFATWDFCVVQTPGAENAKETWEETQDQDTYVWSDIYI